MRTVQAINNANEKGRLGLILYTIPNFPNPYQYKLLTKKLVGLPTVSAIETTIPVQTDFSDHANGLITESHKLASSYPTDWQSSLKELSSEKPNICVLYRATVDQVGFERFIEKASSKIDGVLLEWSEKNEEPYALKSEKHGVEFIKCIGPWMSGMEIKKALANTSDSPLIYLMSAKMTGARLFGARELQKAAKLIKKVRPKAKIAAGFGIKGKKEIAVLAGIPEIDAAIIGSAFLKKAGQGAKYAVSFVESLEESLCRSK